MSVQFFESPILNSPYEYPSRHWELDETGPADPADHRQPPRVPSSSRPSRSRGSARARRRSSSSCFDEGKGLSTQEQQYDPTSIINEVRRQVDQWRALPEPGDWQVTPETARLLQHWRHHEFSSVRPFFCQVEAVETAIWLTEVAPARERPASASSSTWPDANDDANPELLRLALKLATGAGKTTVMAMLIAWQTVNAVRQPEQQAVHPRLPDRHARA